MYSFQYVAGPWNELGPSGMTLHFHEGDRFRTLDFVEVHFDEALRPRSLDLHGRQNDQCLVRVIGACVTNCELSTKLSVLWEQTLFDRHENNASETEDILISEATHASLHHPNFNAMHFMPDSRQLDADACLPFSSNGGSISYHFIVPLRGNAPINWIRMEFDTALTNQVHVLWQTTLIGT